MIKFFRKIRENLLTENKFSKYLVYAVGEIALVMIGILLALSINNWNEHNKLKEKENLALVEILNDLEYSIQDMERIKNDQTGLPATINSIEMLIETMENGKPYHDTLGRHFVALNNYDHADFKTSGFHSLTSIGMDLIEKTDLRSSIGQYYTSGISDYKSAFSEVVKDFHEYILGYIRRDFKFVDMDNENRALIPNDYELLKDNHEFIQSLRTYVDVLRLYLNTLKANLEEAEQLKKDINTYLVE